MGGRGGQGWRFLLILGIIVLGAGGVVLLARSIGMPPEAGPLRTTPEAGFRVESVLAQLLLREAGLSARQDPLVLTSEEVNAFLADHVKVRDSPVWPIRVQIAPPAVELGGFTTVGRLVTAGLGEPLARLLPGAVAERPVWISARGTVAVISAGRAEFEAHTAAIGHQGVPLALFWKVVGGRPTALVWRMPRVVERVEIEPGRLVLHTRRHGSGRAAPG